MAYFRKLGVFVKIPRPGEVKTRLSPPLTDDEACALYRAFIEDLFARLSRLKKIDVTVFWSGADPPALDDMLPPRFRLERQAGENLGQRLSNAFRHLLADDRDVALIIGSDSPDVPLAYLKRAYVKLKHKDVVLGPSSDGGYYLIGLRKNVAPLFDGVSWGHDTVLEATLERIKEQSLLFSLLPLWYDVDEPRSLALLRNMILAKQIEHGDRLRRTEKVLRALGGRLKKA